MTTSDAVTFLKMHGLGNDFVIVDARANGLALDGPRARAIADRRRGVGCDQIIVVEAARDPRADAFMRIVNADGSEAEACGNATRCVASLLMDERRARRAVVETCAGLLDAERLADGGIAVDMGPARDDWRAIPLGEPRDTLHLGIVEGPLRDPVAVNVGNPHAVFFVADADAIALAACGPRIERHPLFPERTNVAVVQVLAPERLRVRVWERGAGITLACGSGACAAVVAAARRGLGARRAEVVLDGGVLTIEWREDGHVRMSGPVAVSFTGRLDSSLLA